MARWCVAHWDSMPLRGLTSYGEIGALLEAALADPAVAGILLDLDSPGGEAGGVFELAQRVRAADAVKPVWAIAADSAFSAAYVLASAASRVYVTQTGGVGSIGVIALHVDQSARDAQQGYRYTAITAGEQKNDFSPHEPLDPAAHTRLQTEVDRLYGIFIDHVATMRKLEPRFVRSTQAGLYFGPEALTAGLADAQGSFDDAVTDFSAFLATRRPPGFSPTATRSLLASSIPSQEISLMTDRNHPRRHPRRHARSGNPGRTGHATRHAAIGRRRSRPVGDRRHPRGRPGDRRIVPIGRLSAAHRGLPRAGSQRLGRPPRLAGGPRREPRDRLDDPPRRRGARHLPRLPRSQPADPGGQETHRKGLTHAQAHRIQQPRRSPQVRGAQSLLA
jgi:signal peptide peptidase SppA